MYDPSRGRQSVKKVFPPLIDAVGVTLMLRQIQKQESGGSGCPKQPPHLQRVLLQLLLRQIDDPYFRDVGGSVERQLHFLVFVKAGVGDFDEEVDVLRLRMSLSIIIFPKIQNGQVRLRLGVLAEQNRVLDTDSVLVRKGGSQPIV